VAELLPQVVWDSRVEWTVQEPLVLFDSVHDHPEIESEEHLHIALAPERYMVEAAYAEIPDEASLILVRFTPHRAPPEGLTGMHSESSDTRLHH
jgi:hypothetical protein